MLATYSKRTIMTPFIYNICNSKQTVIRKHDVLWKSKLGGLLSQLVPLTMALASAGRLEIQTPTRSFDWNREAYELTLGMSFPTQTVDC